VALLFARALQRPLLVGLCLSGATPTQAPLLFPDQKTEEAVPDAERAEGRALVALARIGGAAGSAAEDVVATATRHPRLRYLAIDALDRIGARGTERFLLAASADDEPRVRIAAAQVLAKIGTSDGAALVGVRPTLRDGIGELTFRALDVLVALGPDAAAAIPDVEALRRIDSDVILQRRLDEVLGELRSDDATVAAAMRRLFHGDPDASAIAAIGGARDDRDWDARFCDELPRWAVHGSDASRAVVADWLGEIEAAQARARRERCGAEPAADPAAAEQPPARLFAELVANRGPPLMDPLGHDCSGWHSALATVRAAGAAAAPWFAARLAERADVDLAIEGLVALGPAAVPELRAALRE
jgi:hypothetical protein